MIDDLYAQFIDTRKLIEKLLETHVPAVSHRLDIFQQINKYAELNAKMALALKGQR